MAWGASDASPALPRPSGPEACRAFLGTLSRQRAAVLRVLDTPKSSRLDIAQLLRRPRSAATGQQKRLRAPSTHSLRVQPPRHAIAASSI